jgi:hypothetical protein
VVQYTVCVNSRLKFKRKIGKTRADPKPSSRCRMGRDTVIRRDLQRSGRWIRASERVLGEQQRSKRRNFPVCALFSSQFDANTETEFKAF